MNESLVCSSFLQNLPMANKNRQTSCPAAPHPKLLFIIKNSRGVNSRPLAASKRSIAMIAGAQTNHSDAKRDKQTHRLALGQDQSGEGWSVK